MDENVPVHTINHQAAAKGQVKRRKFGMKKIIISVVAVVVIAIATLIGLLWYQSTMGANISDNEYQAVFLTNGQVYFGKLHTLNGDYMKLTDIYYLQTKTTTSDVQSASSTSASDVTLVKLGNEIHGPEDKMVIARSQILFFENLKNDGKVTESINKYLKK